MVRALRVIFILAYFLRTASVWRGRTDRERGGGGGVCCHILFSYSFPAVQQADHKRDWPPRKAVFFGLATNTPNVRNNNNHIFFITTIQYTTKYKVWSSTCADILQHKLELLIINYLVSDTIC